MIPKLFTIRTTHHHMVNSCDPHSFREFVPSASGFISFVEHNYYLFDRDVVGSMLIFHAEDQADVICSSGARI